MIVRFSAAARSDLRAIVSYLAERNQLSARRLMQRVALAQRRLANFPQLGHYIPEFPKGPHRQFIIAPYRFFYRIDGETVWIVAVWHGKQLPTTPARL